MKKKLPPNFTLWLEFEEVDPTSWNKDNDFCNIHVDLEDGRHYGLNIWTFAFLNSIIAHNQESGQNLYGSYQEPPDLLVKELTRACIHDAIEDLLKKGDLEHLLNPSII